jgi:hypothetical protein
MENLRKANIKVTLVPTIVRGLNDHQIGDIFIEFVNTIIRERENQKSWNFTNGVSVSVPCCSQPCIFKIITTWYKIMRIWGASGQSQCGRQDVTNAVIPFGGNCQTQGN